MCGLFGSIGKNPNVAILRALAIVNRERGTDSLGLFASDGSTIKLANDPMYCLARGDFSDYLAAKQASSWFIAGHTRHGTRGGKTTKNAHPFRYGRIIGSHNGMVSAPWSYDVDSQFLFDRLSRRDGYQKALADIDGYWGLTWYDGEAFYLQAHENTISMAIADDGVWYYSSDGDHLAACVGHAVKVMVLSNGGTVRFTPDTLVMQEMPDFVSEVVPMFTWDKKKTSSTTYTLMAPKASTASAKPKKNKKRKNRSVPVEGGTIGWEEYELMTDLAIEAGYNGFEQYMEEWEFTDEVKAADKLTFMMKDEYANRERWADMTAKSSCGDGFDWREDDANVQDIPF